ncbi:MAG TPA: nucleotide exchange factor GrpE [Kofleriaceae bacterium]|nr:nucleotide exchange factor GrpE [Kofleriaceae bacterium]
MSEPIEGLDATAEAEVDMAETSEAAAPDRASLARALRDLEAAKARVERDAQASAQELREKLVLELVPVLDNLDRTIRAAVANHDSPAVVEGVRLVRNQFMGVLARYGVERVEAKHQRFDPRLHEAISMVPVSHPSAHNVVVDQLEPGYRYGEKLLRPAKVIVGRHQPRYH